MASHNDTSNSRAHALNVLSLRLGTERKVLTGNVTVDIDGPTAHFYDAGASDRTITLPPFVNGGGTTYFIANVGAANDLLVQNANALAVVTIAPGSAAFVVASEAEWTALLASSASLEVFGPSGPGHSTGLVPDPGVVAGATRFLREDGSWAETAAVGISDAYKFITDGVNTATGTGADTFKIRSSDGAIVVTVTNNDGTHGDNVNLTVNEANVDHDTLANYVADQHVAHSGVTLTAGAGLSGGGTIAASRTFDLDLSDLTLVTPELADTIAFYDTSGSATRKATFTTLNGIIDHNSLLNFVANKHIDHTLVSIQAGVGLSGGGDISSTRTLTLDLNSLTADTPVSGDFFPFWDISGSDSNKVSLANLNAALDHNSLANYTANKHIDHTAVAISAGGGLSGGGNIDASRTIALDITGQDSAAAATGDEIIYWDISGSDFDKRSFANLITDLGLYAGGGTDVPVSDGGTGASTLTGILQGNGTSAITGITNSSTVGEVFRVTGAATYAWGALDLATAAAITGDLPFANLTQIAAKSVLGVTGTSTADVAGITGTADQAFRIDAAGTGLSFGALDVSKTAAVTGALRAGCFPALTGDVTTVAGALAATIANDAVTYAKMQNVSAVSKLLGRGDSGAPADVQEITLGSGLTMTGTTLSASAAFDINALTADTPVTGDFFAFYDISGSDQNKVTLANLATAIGVLSVFQPLDTTLTNLAALDATAGYLVETAADTFAKRTLTGTAAQISISNGDGTVGNPVFSFPADVLIPTVLTVPNTGLHLLDTNASHDLIIKPGSDITADRTLTLTTGDANRTLTLTADSSIGGTAYVAGGTDVALADGGTGASLADPNIDLVMGWDDSAGAVKFMALADINTEAAPTTGDFLLMYDAAGNLLKTNWSNLPGAAGGIPTIGSSTDTAIVRWNGTGGATVQNSGVLIDSSNDILLPTASKLNWNSGAVVLEKYSTEGVLITASGGEIYFSAKASGDGCGAQFYSVTNAGTDYAFSEVALGLKNLDASPSATQIYSFGAEGKYSDLHIATEQRFYVYRADTAEYVLVHDATTREWTFVDKNNIGIDSAATNIPVPILRTTVTSSGTPAAGFGPQWELEAENASGTKRVIASIEGVYSDPTNASEDADLACSTIVAGTKAIASWIPRVKRHGSSSHSVTGVTGTSVTDLKFNSVQPGTYRVEYLLLCQSDTSTTGIGLGFNFTGTAASKMFMRYDVSTITTASNGLTEEESGVALVTGGVMNAWTTKVYSTTAPNTMSEGVGAINSDILIKCEGLVIVTAAGDLELWHSSQIAATTTIIKAGSSAVLTKTA